MKLCSTSLLQGEVTFGDCVPILRSHSWLKSNFSSLILFADYNLNLFLRVLQIIEILFMELIILFLRTMQTWKSLPDSNEISKEFPSTVLNGVEPTLDRLAASNLFFIAKRKHSNQDVLYLSAKIPRGIPFLIELTAAVGVPGLKCAIKTPNSEMAPLFFEAVETLLKS